MTSTVKGWVLGALVILAVAPLTAAAQTHGDWTVGSTGNTFWAVSVNDSGQVFGQFCYPAEGSCVWLIGLPTKCVDNDKYPVLVNSEAGSSHLHLRCAGELEGGRFRYAFADFSAIDGLVRSSGPSTQIGFAIPLADGYFRVVRFALRGATPAISSMRDVAEKQVRPTIRGTRDEKL